MSEQGAAYLELWQRMNRVVQAFVAAGEEETANYFMTDFFLTFPDMAELALHVENAEGAAADSNLAT